MHPGNLHVAAEGHRADPVLDPLATRADEGRREPDVELAWPHPYREGGPVLHQNASLVVEDAAARRLDRDDAHAIVLGGVRVCASRQDLKEPQARDQHAEHGEDDRPHDREPQAGPIVDAGHRPTSEGRGRSRAPSARTRGKTNGVSKQLYAAARTAARTTLNAPNRSPSTRLNAA